MDNPEAELEALRAQVAALTARVHNLEVKAGVERQVYQGITPSTPAEQRPVETAKQPASQAATTPPPPSSPHPVRPPAFPTPSAPRRDSQDLEGTIGRLWFNRVGIFALLFGVAFFLKYAFENN